MEIAWFLKQEILFFDFKNWLEVCENFYLNGVAIKFLYDEVGRKVCVPENKNIG